VHETPVFLAAFHVDDLLAFMKVATIPRIKPTTPRRIKILYGRIENEVRKLKNGLFSPR